MVGVRSAHLCACILDHNIKGVCYSKSWSEFGKILRKEHKDCNSGISIFAFNLCTLYPCHFFFLGCEPFRLDMTLPLGREEKLWMMEAETQGGGRSGERQAARGPHHLPDGLPTPALHRYPALLQQLLRCLPAPGGGLLSTPVRSGQSACVPPRV